MKNKKDKNYNSVGPVLIAGDLTDKIVAVIKELNKQVKVQSQGSYIRILVPFECVLTCKAIEEKTGSPFVLPEDLELIMPAFKGYFSVTKDEARWSFAKQDTKGDES